MNAEEFANGSATTQLSAGITDTDVTISVVSSSGFPSRGNFRIRIGEEYLLVTSVSGTTWTVVRGVEDSAAQSAVGGTTVEFMLTAGAISQFRQDNTSTTLITGSSPREGVLYFPDALPYIYRYNGSIWEAFGPVWKNTVPKSSDFTALNHGTMTLDETKGVLRLLPPVDSTLQIRGFYAAAPSTPYRVVAAMTLTEDFSQFWGACILLRESSSGKLTSFGPIYRDTGGVRGDAIKWDSAAVFNASYAPLSSNLLRLAELPCKRIWWSVQDDGTNRKYDFSFNGFNFYNYITIGRTDFLTPDQVGFGVIAGHGTFAPKVSFYHFKVF